MEVLPPELVHNPETLGLMGVPAVHETKFVMRVS
jgi:hypothetical protein